MRQSLAWSVDGLGSSLFSSTSNREEHQPINTKSTMKVTSIWLAALAVALWPSNGAFADQCMVGTDNLTYSQSLEYIRYTTMILSLVPL
mmetsp:Transcript_43808/g.92110  ORF Transcript_43808/g.92110 Transcript_43808/m.92110 type:complete len:89 (-) Transcript_43808:484-750(-)